MKKIVERIIGLRNPSFKLDNHITLQLLAGFCLQQSIQMLRSAKLLFNLRSPRRMLMGRGVRFFNLNAIQYGKYVKLGEFVYLSAMGTGKITLGDNVGIGAFSRIIISTSLNNLGTGISIGNNVGIGEFAYLGGAGGLTIDDDCIIGQYFSCHPENHNYQDTHLPIRHQGVTRKGIAIGANCWIGSKVTILDGVTIGEGCVIAAGSVVTKNFPSNSVIGGVPAKVLKTRMVSEKRYMEESI